ncbi:P-loop containing nucleoside triphosphate hydrolase protein [Elsinoe ampelina]|uniref:P-loop containing nucleoside triphosphate hydrolase protein n=1 Tax=Elsinoe ampelina TaxID=302913 RepID=A0A6A6GDH1_9PEZI|nr:P-loop containing nucleoside triphosphate hydrolase protein [Elsinoe ampelina]
MARSSFHWRSRRSTDGSMQDVELAKSQPPSGRRHQRKRTPSEEPTKLSEPPIPYSAILTFTNRSHTTILVVGITAAIVKGVAGPAGALLTGKIFGALSGYRPGVTTAESLIASVRQNILYLLVVAGASFFVHFVFFTAWVIFGERQAKEARHQLFNALLKQEVAWFDRRKEGPSAMLPRLNAQIRDLQLASSQPLGAVVAIIANACFSFGLAMFYSWKLTLVIIASIPVVLVFTVLTNRPVSFRGHMQQQKKTEALKVMSDALNTIDIVKCANAQDYETQRYAQKIKEVAYWFYKTVNINATQQGFVQFMASALFVQAFYYGGVLVRSGEKNPGDIITTFLSALSIFTSLNSVNAQMLVLELGRIAGGRMQKILWEVEKTATDVDDAEEDYTPKTLFNNLKGSIEFRDVAFAYPTRREHNILKGFNLMLPIGSMSFVVGRSGSGKSTLGQLLTRLYDPANGHISIAGLDISHFNKKHIRQLVQLVEQQSTLFNESIRENLMMGMDAKKRSETSDYNDLLEDAIDFALLRTFVNNQDKNIHTMVGRHGTAVSGGQRQRLAIARARIRDAPILILDESTSALDSVNRDMIIEAVRYWRQGRTTIVITHNMELIKPDDYIYVMENGKLIKEGYREDVGDIATRTPPPEYDSSDIASLSRHPGVTEDLIESYLDVETFDVPISGMRALSMLQMPRMRFSTAVYNYPWIQPDLSPPASLGRHSPPEKSPRFQKRLSAFLPSRFQNGLSVHPTRSRSMSTTERPNSIDASSRRASTNSSEAAVRAGNIAKSQRAVTQLATKRVTGQSGLQHTTLLRLDEEYPKQGEAPQTPGQLPILTFKQIIKTVWPALGRKQRATLVAAFPISAVHAASSPVTSLLTTKLIGTYSFGPGSQRQAMIYALAIIAVAIVDGSTQYTQQMAFEYVSQNWVNNIRKTAASRIFSQSKEWFNHDGNSTGRLVETLDRHADESRNVVGRFVPLYTIVAYLCTISIIWALVTEYRITLVTISFFPLIFGLTKLFGSVSRKWEGRSNDAAERVNLVFIDTFSCIKTVKLLTAERQFQAKAAAAYDSAYAIGRKRARWSGGFYGLSEASATLAQAVIFYYGAVLVTKGVAVSDITLVLLMLIMAFTQVTMILGVIPQASLSRDAATRLLSLTNLSPTSHESHGSTRPRTIGDIEFRDVTFAYPSRPVPPALSDVSFIIPQGKYVAIVGESGSGKSTITALLTRLYDLPRSLTETKEDTWDVTFSPTSGMLSPSIKSPWSQSFPPRSPAGPVSSDILLSGRSISSHHTATLRERIALVQQSTPLLSASVSANISYGLESVDPATIRWAAAAAGADFIDSLPEGFETLIGEGGLGLSGGQQQRIAIARALARRPDVLVLDEPTSALDSETMNGVRDTLWELRREGTTVVVVTHEKKMVEMADMVVVLEGGRVVEKGSWGWLMAQRGGAMRKLWFGREQYVSCKGQ